MISPGRRRPSGLHQYRCASALPVDNWCSRIDRLNFALARPDHRDVAELEQVEGTVVRTVHAGRNRVAGNRTRREWEDLQLGAHPLRVGVVRISAGRYDCVIVELEPEIVAGGSLPTGVRTNRLRLLVR